MVSNQRETGPLELQEPIAAPGQNRRTHNVSSITPHLTEDQALNEDRHLTVADLKLLQRIRPLATTGCGACGAAIINHDLHRNFHQQLALTR